MIAAQELGTVGTWRVYPQFHSWYEKVTGLISQAGVILVIPPQVMIGGQIINLHPGT